MNTLKQNIKQGLDQAICSRGKNKGNLKKKCPPVGTLGSAVWNALMGFSNPHKVGMGHMMFLSPEGREVYDHINRVGNFIDLTTFDQDGNTLRSLGLI